MFINNWVDIIKIRYSTESKCRKCVKGYDFLSFSRKLVINIVKN